jgi:hypothetical protein
VLQLLKSVLKVDPDGVGVGFGVGVGVGVGGGVGVGLGVGVGFGVGVGSLPSIGSVLIRTSSYHIEARLL